ncbi:MAG: PQQ-binding-like beta-propeller repeat protein [Phycisphaerales bacterium]|nr:PQQ-binding-like beta-propeller repeat protein [Phycisphaerales bacterium]
MLVIAMVACVVAAEPGTPVLKWTVPIKSASFGGGAIADADGDGAMDVAFATYFGDARVRVLRGKDGSELWSYHDPDANRDDCYDASCRFAVLDGAKGNGSLSLVVPCSSGCRVLALDAKSGTVLWNTYLGDGECIDTPPFIGPVDSAGTLGIVVGTFKGKLHVLKGADGSVIRSLKIAPGAVQSCPIVMDLNNDGTPDFIGGNFRGDHAMHAVDGTDGHELWSVKTGSHIYHGPSIWHPTGDGSIHFAFGSYDGKVYSVDSAGKPDFIAEPGERYIMAPTAIVDIDGDGRDECIATCEHVTAINGKGEIVWKGDVTPKQGWDSVTRGVAIADLSGDGNNDLAYVTGDGLFRVLDARDGSKLYAFDAGGVCGEGKKVTQSSHGVILGDLDGDGLLDAFFVLGGMEERKDGVPTKRYGAAVCLTGFKGKASETNQWPMFRHDAGNSGNARMQVMRVEK